MSWNFGRSIFKVSKIKFDEETVQRNQNDANKVSDENKNFVKSVSFGGHDDVAEDELDAVMPDENGNSNSAVCVQDDNVNDDYDVNDDNVNDDVEVDHKRELTVQERLQRICPCPAGINAIKLNLPYQMAPRITVGL